MKYLIVTSLLILSVNASAAVMCQKSLEVQEFLGDECPPGWTLLWVR